MEFKGFYGVLIHPDGIITSQDNAKVRGEIIDGGFMRDDGWSLGYVRGLKEVAFQYQSSEWTHKIEIKNPLDLESWRPNNIKWEKL